MNTLCSKKGFRLLYSWPTKKKCWFNCESSHLASRVSGMKFNFLLLVPNCECVSLMMFLYLSITASSFVMLYISLAQSFEGPEGIGKLAPYNCVRHTAQRPSLWTLEYYYILSVWCLYDADLLLPVSPSSAPAAIGVETVMGLLRSFLSKVGEGTLGEVLHYWTGRVGDASGVLQAWVGLSLRLVQCAWSSSGKNWRTGWINEHSFNVS